MSAPPPLKDDDRAVPATGPEATGASMRTGVGDEIVGLHHPDGSPPHDVRWADSGRVTLYGPGPDACIRHLVTGDGHVPAR
ncbi:hypothetical protein GCM10010300_36240 [Streptomyces olivaceoviridis]|uniref:DUF1918 domain-containing protein n=1 Tax=Streptomyces olivaceoviridis TaxID=1921 RepID=UPI0016796EA0|nr:DUF1918 domain-containing protein [Streptomyces olivaceoviridis]GGY88884.1 hypothetical protein GCM10010300_36240 [Streptomyces olivaceoviridis]